MARLRLPFLAKLMFAFLAQALLVLVIVFIIASLTLHQSFRAFQAQGGLLQARSLQGLLAYYYATNGSWQGIEALIHPVPDRSGPDRDLILADLSGTIIASTQASLQGLRLKESSFEFAIPIIVRGQQVGTLLIFSDPDSWKPLENRFLWQVTVWLMIGGLIAAGGAVLLSLAISRHVVGPLRQLTAAVEAVPEGRWQPLRIETGDEVQQLAMAFHEMAQRLERSEQARRHLLVDLAHELRTPLAALQSHLELLLEREGSASAEELAPLYDRLLLLERLVDDLYLLARAEVKELRLACRFEELAPLIEGAVALVRPLAQERSISLRVEVAPGIQAWVDSHRLEQVLLNLLSNAVRHTPQGGQIEVRAGLQGDGEVCISVFNSGSAIAPEELPYVFERFWQSDRASHQGGVGLAIAKRLVEAHGGRIWVKSEPGLGTTFSFTVRATPG